METLTPENFSQPFFNLLENDVFKLQEDFSELRIRAFLENC
jgi:hypothetical protein